MKKSKNLVLFFITVFILTMSVFTVANAANVNRYLLKNASGELRQNESKTFNFSMPSDETATIYFYNRFDELDGYEGEYEYTYGTCNLTLKDSSENVVFSRKEYLGSDGAKYTVSLKKGNYSLTLYGPDSYKFTYRMSVYYVEDVKTTSVTLDKTSLALTKGSSSKLKATLTPSDSPEVLTWTSSNTSVATVSNGKVTAKALGKAKITAKSGSKSASCNVTVNKLNVDIFQNKSADLSAYVKNISDYKNGTWSSSNKAVATVNSSGLVTGKTNGTCNIIFKLKDGTAYTVALSVYNNSKIYLLKNKSGILLGGESKTYSFTLPVDGKTTLYFHESSDEDFFDDYTYGSCMLTVKDSSGATVYTTEKNFMSSGQFSLRLKKGTYKLTLKGAGDDDFDEFNYKMSVYFYTTANIKTTKISLDKTALNLSKGKSATLKATVSPSYTPDTLSWTSSNKSVASVSNGKVTANALGKTTVTAKSGSKSASCKVTVTNLALNIYGESLNLMNYVKNISDYKKRHLVKFQQNRCNGKLFRNCL
ncbi:MAG: Ig-like domain-containing protein [Acutalibacteraceae bacterium]